MRCPVVRWRFTPAINPDTTGALLQSPRSAKRNSASGAEDEHEEEHEEEEEDKTSGEVAEPRTRLVIPNESGQRERQCSGGTKGKARMLKTNAGPAVVESRSAGESEESSSLSLICSLGAIRRRWSIRSSNRIRRKRGQLIPMRPATRHRISLQSSSPIRRTPGAPSSAKWAANIRTRNLSF